MKTTLFMQSKIGILTIGGSLFILTCLMILTSPGNRFWQHYQTTRFLQIENNNPGLPDIRPDVEAVQQLKQYLAPRLSPGEGITLKMVAAPTGHPSIDQWQLADGTQVTFGSYKTYRDSNRFVIEVFLDIPRLKEAQWQSGVTAEYLQTLIYQALSEEAKDPRESIQEAGLKLRTAVDPTHTQFLVRLKL